MTTRTHSTHRIPAAEITRPKSETSPDKNGAYMIHGRTTRLRVFTFAGVVHHNQDGGGGHRQNTISCVARTLPYRYVMHVLQSRHHVPLARCQLPARIRVGRKTDTHHHGENMESLEYTANSALTRDAAQDKNASQPGAKITK